MDPASAFILDQTEPFRSILLHLKGVIEREIPDVTLKFKYRIPFYYLEGRPFCYLNQTEDYVDLGFWMAAHLSVHLDKMNTKGRKMMKSLRYRNLGDIDEDILCDILRNAYEVRNKKFYS
ncbi:MAG: DUF1801 domain-containing protein [Flavobacteriaceae bacterium]|nr:DUF1801 domain-containing protein [Muriicola sp.]NNC63090.1 DUF1801 domain-containing protein [Eudoraea sp.]NNL38422.1 DUF1801 domain-containing protein [Flavobacteriaceae bacterium]